jgi:hypothetical protein
MRVDSACELINQLCYKPGWKFTASDHTNRFESSIKVRIDYPALNSNREQAADGYQDEIPVTYAEYPILVDDLDDMGLYRVVVDIITDIETHEAREFLRVCPTYWAPFHPHRAEGMRRWRDTEGITRDHILEDQRFGIA